MVSCSEQPHRKELILTITKLMRVEEPHPELFLFSSKCCATYVLGHFKSARSTLVSMEGAAWVAAVAPPSGLFGPDGGVA